MFKNYLKITLRNLLRNKSYSFINITGLAAGMCSAILILLWVQDELSYNNFHENLGQIYLVPQTQYYEGGREFKVFNSPAPLAPALKTEYPEVLYSVRYGRNSQNEMLIQYGEKSFEERIAPADPEFFKMFTFPFTAGNKDDPFPQVHSLVLTKEAARRIFGSEDPLGKTLKLNARFDFTVTGVLENVPANSDLDFQIVIPYNFLKEAGVRLDEWFSNTDWTFVQLKPGADWNEFSRKIKDRLKKEDDESKSELFLFPFARYHLYTLDGNNQQVEKVRLFSIIAFAVLLIACINFMNLSTARSAKRSREVGLRKVVGANRNQLIRQFFGESIGLTLVSLFIALLLVEILLPGFNELADKKLDANYFSNGFIFIVLTVTLITGITAGSYPALFLSSFSPVKVLKENLQTGKKGSFLRKVLVVIQFSLSIILIISTIVVYSQLNFMKNKEVGYNDQNVFYIRAKGDLVEKYEIFKDRLLKDMNVMNVSISSSKPSFIGTNGGGFEWEGKDPNQDALVSMITVDDDFQKTFDLKLTEGRFFSKEFPSDTVDAVVINEKFAGLMNEGSKVGRIIKRDSANYRIIGVLKDFHFYPVRFPIEPLMMWCSKSWASYVFVKVNGKNTPEALDYVKQTYAEVNPAYPFSYTFLDEEYDRLYKSEERLGKLFNYFAVLAVLISCLGLFGLASFMAEQRRKEIGVRKVLGSSVAQVVVLLSKSFAALVLISNIIAWPIAYFFMKDWLEDFAYRINMNLFNFIISAAVALIIALIAVSYQAVKAASANPIKSIKYE